MIDTGIAGLSCTYRVARTHRRCIPDVPVAPARGTAFKVETVQPCAHRLEAGGARTAVGWQEPSRSAITASRRPIRVRTKQRTRGAIAEEMPLV